LLADLATLARNTIITAITPNYPLTVTTSPAMQQPNFPTAHTVDNSRPCALSPQEPRAELVMAGPDPGFDPATALAQIAMA
jgi:hypothetical protein